MYERNVESAKMCVQEIIINSINESFVSGSIACSMPYKYKRRGNRTFQLVPDTGETG